MTITSLVCPCVAVVLRLSASSRASFHNFGAEWLDKNGQPSINTPEAIAAFEYYGRILRESGPPGSTNHHFTETNSMLVSGRAAMTVEGTVFAGIYEDPARSQMVGQIGYHPMPVGPGGDHPIVNGWGIAMHSKSRNKDASWLFMQWGTSKETLLNLAMAGQGSPRSSIWNDAGYQAASKSPEDWRRAVAHTIEVGTTPLRAAGHTGRRGARLHRRRHRRLDQWRTGQTCSGRRKRQVQGGT